MRSSMATVNRPITGETQPAAPAPTANATELSNSSGGAHIDEFDTGEDAALLPTNSYRHAS